jgi:hypothetical protein
MKAETGRVSDASTFLHQEVSYPREERTMPTVKLVGKNDPDPVIQRVFADIKATKKIDFIPAIWRALATNPQHLELAGRASRRSSGRVRSIC